MKKNIVLIMFLTLAFLLATIPAMATSSDDYKVIKKAVSDNKSSGEVSWFRLEVIEKGAKKESVKIRIPIALVDALSENAEDLIKNNKEFGEKCGKIDIKKIMGILKENGPMTLIEIEAEDSSVKIWLE